MLYFCLYSQIKLTFSQQNLLSSQEITFIFQKKQLALPFSFYLRQIVFLMVLSVIWFIYKFEKSFISSQKCDYTKMPQSP